MDSPEFTVPTACVYTLSTPSEFYALLLAGCSQATTRVTLSSLYLGTGNLERALLHALRARLQCTPALTAVLHFDLGRALRRTGGGGRDSTSTSTSNSTSTSTNSSTSISTTATVSPYSSAALLLELLRDEQGRPCPALAARARIDLTQLPSLRGLLGAVAAPRVSEGLGVWHAKAYVLDNHTAILTGANLSTDYFTTRQDRYVVVSSQGGRGGAAGEAAVGAFVNYLHTTLASLGDIAGSHRLLGDGSVQVLGSEASSCCPPRTAGSTAAAAAAPAAAATSAASTPAAQSPVRYTPLPLFSPLHATFSASLKRILLASSSAAPMGSSSTSSSASTSSPPPAAPGTITLRPRWQLGSLGVRCDEQALRALLATGQRPAPLDTLHLATGYFNLPSWLQAALIHHPRSYATCIHLLTASPLANGFWGASGIAGAIPLAYCQLERVFYRAAAGAGRLMRDPEGQPASPGIAIHEYERPGWTFHAKGLWLHRRGTSSSSSEGESMTSLAGSSNYGLRGLHRDLELQVELSSSDPAACAMLARERDGLFVQRQHVRAIGGHLSAALGYGRERDVFSAAVTPHRALVWRRAAWANGAWIYGGYRVLKSFF